MAVDQLVRQHVAVSSTIQTNLQAAVSGAWAVSGGLDDASLAQWLSLSLPLVQAAQLQMSAATEAYLSATVAELSGRPPQAIGTPEVLVVGPRIRRGVDPAEVYSRPVIEARSLVAAGIDRPEALRRAGTRAVSLAATDVQSAKLYTAQHFMTNASGVVGYRRTLSGSHSCGLCVVASTRRYHRSELLPRHPGCDCGVVPIVGDHDPGEVLNRELLESMHGAVAETYGPDAVKRAADTDAYSQLYKTYGHGEYGPTLVKPGDHVMKTKAASARPEPKPIGATTPAILVDHMPGGGPPGDWRKIYPDKPVGQIFELEHGPMADTMSQLPGKGLGYITDDGRLFYVEHVASDEAGHISSRLKLEALLKHEAEALPKGMKGTPATLLVKDRCTLDAEMARFGGGRVAGNAGVNRVVFFGGMAEPEAIWHETGHVVARRLNETGHSILAGVTNPKVAATYGGRLVTKEQQTLVRHYIGWDHEAAPGRLWGSAALADMEHLVKGTRIYNWEVAPSTMSAPSLTGEGAYGLARMRAVTDYAASVPHFVEDFSESWRLMIKTKVEGKIGRGELSNTFVPWDPKTATGNYWENPQWTDIGFADLFPNRQRYIEDALKLMGYSLP